MKSTNQAQISGKCDGGMVQDCHKDFRAIDEIMSKTLK